MVKCHFSKKPFSNHIPYRTIMNWEMIVLSKKTWWHTIRYIYELTNEQRIALYERGKRNIRWLEMAMSFHTSNLDVSSSVIAWLFTILHFVHEKLAMSKWNSSHVQIEVFVCGFFFSLLNYSKLKQNICMWNLHA